MGTSMSDGGAAARGRPVNPIILIPARLQSVRLPDKPLADIAGVPMIVHVMRRAEETDLGRVAVACAEREIAEAVTAAGGEAVMTRADHASGSDRIYEALMHLDGDGKHDAVINLQGDLPTVTPDLPRAALDLLHDPEVDIGTLAAEIRDGCNAVLLGAIGDPRAPVGSCQHRVAESRGGRLRIGAGVQGRAPLAGSGDARAQAVMDMDNAEQLCVLDHKQVGDRGRVHQAERLAGERVRADCFGAAGHHIGGAQLE